LFEEGVERVWRVKHADLPLSTRRFDMSMDETVDGGLTETFFIWFKDVILRFDWRPLVFRVGLLDLVFVAFWAPGPHNTVVTVQYRRLVVRRLVRVPIDEHFVLEQPNLGFLARASNLITNSRSSLLI